MHRRQRRFDLLKKTSRGGLSCIWPEQQGLNTVHIQSTCRGYGNRNKLLCTNPIWRQRAGSPDDIFVKNELLDLKMENKPDKVFIVNIKGEKIVCITICILTKLFNLYS